MTVQPLQLYCLLLRYLIVPALLLVASVMDLKSREIDVYIFLAGILLSIPVTISEILAIHKVLLAPIYLFEDLLVLGVLAAFVLLGFKGLADLLAFIVIALAYPIPAGGGPFTPVFATFFYYVSISILIVLGLFVYNLLFNHRDLRRLPFPYKLIYPLIAVPKPVKKLLENPGWWYPLNLCNYSLVYDINLDPEDIRRGVMDALEKQCIRPNDRVWCSYGVPAIPLILAAYMLYIAFGGEPVLNLIKILAGLH